MKKKCPSCEKLNAAGAMICSSCKQSLFNAEEVYEQEEGSVAINESTRSVQKENVIIETPVPAGNCSCKFPSPNTEGICRACDGVVGAADEQTDNHHDSTIETTTQANGIQPEPAQQRTPPVFFIHIRNQGIRYQLNDRGTVLGRGSYTADVLRHYFQQYAGISHHHLWVATDGSKLLVMDLNARNGSRAGTCTLQPLHLHTFTAADLPISVQLGRHCFLEIEAQWDGVSQ